jgi:ketosteroid isomerase-like protein
MSTETLTDNVATVTAIYEAFGRGDIPFILSNISDDCRWEAMGKGSSAQGGTYTGKGAADFFNNLLGEVEFVEFNPVSINHAGNNTVAAFGNLKGISKATGKPHSTDWAMRWVFNDAGKIVEYQNYHDSAALYKANQN